MKSVTSYLSKEPLSIFTVWLFTISGIIGMSIGYYEWFIVKTPLNLLVLFGLLVINFPINDVKKIGIAILFFVAGFMVEWLGVRYGILFGVYTYGSNLGPKIDGVPLLIGVNWAMLTLASAAIAQHFLTKKWFRAAFGALLMVSLDFFIEPAAPLFDFWTWDLGYAPLQNFVAWYIISFLLHLIYTNTNIKGEFRFSLHVFLAQFVFFLYFFFYHGI